MIENNLDIKEKFVEMCKLLFVNSKGEFCFPYDNLIHDNDWSDFINHSDYSVLESKMQNLVKLVNSDNSILELDVEDEIWEMI